MTDGELFYIITNGRGKMTGAEDDRTKEEVRWNLVDVREESEWAQGHLPGAIHLGKGIIERDIE
jgi:rhodanese-related sulfurtransferase